MSYTNLNARHACLLQHLRYYAAIYILFNTDEHLPFLPAGINSITKTIYYVN